MARLSIVAVLAILAAGAVAWWALREHAVEDQPEHQGQIAEIPVKQWQSVTQPLELGAWMMRGEAECREVPKTSEWTMRRFGFEKDTFVDKVLLDVGPGPVGRLTWLDGEFIAIEPLAGELKRLPYARLEKYHTIYEQPAELRIEELVGTVDYIVAINSLDHAFNLPMILSNMHAYLKPGGGALISVTVDIEREEPDPYHPLRLRQGPMRELLEEHGFEILREERGRCTPTEESWGDGVGYHWWLRKPGINEVDVTQQPHAP